MADRNIDAFCADLEEVLADESSRRRNWADVPLSRWCTRGARIGSLPISTVGKVSPTSAGTAFVYVAGPRYGHFKVGMSGNPARRSVELGAKMIVCREVHASLARHVETETLRICGVSKGEGEWVKGDVHRITAALDLAVARVSKKA